MEAETQQDSVQFTEQQLEAINVRGHNIVSAGAGTGKTAVLVERFLSLLERDGFGVENILCLTFTRKAASEMYQRIYQRLNHSSSPALQREFLRFDKARITTIDSFCSRIIKPYAAEYGYSSSFRIVDEQELDSKLESFTSRYLAKPESNRIITRLLEHFTYINIVTKLFMSLARKYASNIQAPGNHADHFFSRIEKLLHTELTSFRERRTQILETNNEYRQDTGNKKHHSEALEELDNCLNEIMTNKIMLSESVSILFITGQPELLTHLIGLFRRIISALAILAVQRTARKPWKQFKQCHTQLKTVLLPALIILSEHKFYSDFYALIEDYLNRVTELKRKMNIMIYRDILETSVQILINHPDCADYYRTEIHHIMIDEFQDNNSLQRDLLFLLSVPVGYNARRVPEFIDLDSSNPGVGQLFFVGDQKQSIYRFRGADVSVFKNLGNLFQNGGRILSLNRNYRSNPMLIDFFNRFFPRIMKSEVDFEADYEVLETGLEQKTLSHIEFIIIPHDDENRDVHVQNDVLSPVEAEAYAIANRIHTICTTQNLKKQDGSAPVSYNDIAILFRSGSTQHLLEKMLRHFSIPFTSDSTYSLFLDAPAFDIHAFIKLCLFPDDHFSLAALLRSPFCRMGDDAIVRLLLSVSKEKMRDRYLSQEDGFLPEDIEKYNSLQNLLGVIRPLLGHLSHVEVLGEIWKRSGYLDFVASSEHRRSYLEYYDYLVEFFDLYADQAPVDLLQALESNLDTTHKISNLGLVQNKQAGVRLMTVHKAKGLEFPVVFLVNNNYRSKPSRELSSPWVRGEDDELILYAGLGRQSIEQYFADIPHITSSFQNPLVKQAESLERRKENAETCRLLYVALTRAKQHLFISASRVKTATRKNTQSYVIANKNIGREEGNVSGAEKIENLFNLITNGLNLNTQTLNQYSEYPPQTESSPIAPPGLSRTIREYDSAAGRVFINIPESVPRASLENRRKPTEKSNMISGPPRLLLLPPTPKTNLTVSDFQMFLYTSKDTQRVENEFLPYSQPEHATNLGDIIHYMLKLTTEQFFRSRNISIPPLPPVLMSHYDNAHQLYQEAYELISAFTTTAFFQSIVDAEKLYCEFPFTMYLKPFFVSGRIDLVICRGDETFLIDYKTSRNLDQLDYSVQLDLYRLALEMMKYPQIEAGLYDMHRNEFLRQEARFGKKELIDIARTITQTEPQRSNRG